MLRSRSAGFVLVVNEHHLRDGFDLEPYRIYPLEGRIEGPEGSRHIQPKVMEVLVFLAQHHGHVVPREEIVDTVWRGSVVTDEALTRCISELRHVFDDRKKNPKYIQTIPKRGYRLVPAPKVLAAPEPVLESVMVAGPTVAPIDQEPRSFWHELNRRNVVRVTLAYLAVGFAILGGAELLADILTLPDWTLRFLLLLLILGLPIAITLAWTLQVTPQGLSLDIPVATDPDAPTVSQRGRLNFIIGLALTVAGATWFFQTKSGTETGEPAAETGYRNSVAVMRFRVMSDDENVQYFADGLSDELSRLLYRTKLVKVPSREWTWSLMDKEVPDIAQRLDVRNLVEGTVRAENNLLRASITLIGRNGNIKWRQDYEREYEALFDLQNQIAVQVLSELRVKLSAEAEMDINQTLTLDPDAYLSYLEGRYFLREPPSQATLQRARQSFAQAIQLDSNFAGAYAGLCDTFLEIYILEKAFPVVEDAEATCQKAVDLDDTLAAAHVSLARLNRNLGRYLEAERAIEQAKKLRDDSAAVVMEHAAILAARGRTQEAEALYRDATYLEPLFWQTHRALGYFLVTNGDLNGAKRPLTEVTRLIPDDGLAHSDLGVINHMLGNFSDAASSYQRSLEVSPTQAAYSNTATMQFYLGNFEAAIELYQQALELSPNDHRVWGNLADAQRYAFQEDIALDTYARAIALAEQEIQVNSNDGETLSDLAYYYASIEDGARAQETLARALTLTPNDMYTHYRSALVNLRNDRREQALDALENAVSLGYQPTLLLRDPGLATIADDARFLALLER